MNYSKLLERLRKSYAYRHNLIDKTGTGLSFSFTPNARGTEANDEIFKLLVSKKPCFIGRFGGVELSAICNYLDVRKSFKDFHYVKNTLNYYKWDANVLDALGTNAGFFSNRNNKLVDKFCELMVRDMRTLDLLGSWLENERFVKSYLPKNLTTVPLIDLEPYFHEHPWTRALRGKKILIIHPFEESIQKQYRKRELLFTNKEILPDFELITIKAVQTIAGNNTNIFKDWFEALDYMKKQIDITDFDIAIIGAGAYGFPLAAHIKRNGKKAIHLGGATQLLFGIIGKRWEEAEMYKGFVEKYVNEHWVRPSASEMVSNSNAVEGSTYW